MTASMEAPKRWWVLTGGGRGGVLFSSFILSFFLFPSPFPPVTPPPPLPPPYAPPPPLIFASSDMRGNLQQVEGVSAGEEGVPWVAAPTAFPKTWETAPCPRGSRQEEAQPPRGRRVGAPRGPEAAPRRPQPTWGRLPAAPRRVGRAHGERNPGVPSRGAPPLTAGPAPTPRALRGVLGGTPQGGEGRGSADRGGSGSGRYGGSSVGKGNGGTSSVPLSPRWPGMSSRGRGAPTMVRPVVRRPRDALPAQRLAHRRARCHGAAPGEPALRHSAPLFIGGCRRDGARPAPSTPTHIPLPGAGPGELPRSWVLPPAPHSALGGAGPHPRSRPGKGRGSHIAAEGDL